MLRFTRSAVVLSAGAISGIICLIPSATWARGGGGHSGSSGGSVQVNGYTRSNGTHVESYTRSAPGGGASADYSSPSYSSPDYSSPSYSSSSYSSPIYGEQSLINSLPKLSVNGYTRSNGTYVAPYTRSVPEGSALPDYSSPSYGQQSSMNSLPKLSVNGYTTHNGTYVGPYTRLAPGGGALPDHSSPSYSSSSYSSPTYGQQSLTNSLPKSKTMSSGGEDLISTVEVNINGKSFAKVGIMVGGQAYVPAELLKVIPISSGQQLKDVTLTLYSAQTLGIPMLNYSNRVFIQASGLQQLYSNLLISWDNKNQVVVLQTKVS